VILGLAHKQFRPLPFFSQISTFVLAEPDESNNLLIAASRTAAGPAVSCFLSPIHAIVEARHWISRGKRYEVHHAGTITPDTFVNADRTALMAQLRLGWPALDDGKIVPELNGNTATCAKLMIHSVRSGLPPVFELDPETLEQVDRLHERVGMYAWREVYRNMREWDKARMDWAATRAVKTMEITTADEMQCTKVALFDPEFGQWHYVPLADL
jgi:hypothetical protein